MAHLHDWRHFSCISTEKSSGRWVTSVAAESIPLQRTQTLINARSMYVHACRCRRVGVLQITTPSCLCYARLLPTAALAPLIKLTVAPDQTQLRRRSSAALPQGCTGFTHRPCHHAGSAPARCHLPRRWSRQGLLAPRTCLTFLWG